MTTTTAEQIEARSLRTTRELVAMFEATQEQAYVTIEIWDARGWMMEELERRSPEGYAAWMLSADYSPRRFFTF